MEPVMVAFQCQYRAAKHLHEATVRLFDLSNNPVFGCEYCQAHGKALLAELGLSKGWTLRPLPNPEDRVGTWTML
jgi:hypothetical protein